MKVQTNNHPTKKYPTIGACGLDCGLCPSFHREGKSRCPGCCGDAFWEAHPGCPFITCAVKQKGLETCGQCNEFEFCPRVMKLLENAKHSDSTISYIPVSTNLACVRKNGIEMWALRQNKKITFLKTLLTDYNDGRHKTFYCLSVQLLPVNQLKLALGRVQKKISTEMSPKDRTFLIKNAFDILAAKSGCELKLRRGNKKP
jgi:hypothetical protein